MTDRGDAAGVRQSQRKRRVHGLRPRPQEGYRFALGQLVQRRRVRGLGNSRGQCQRRHREAAFPAGCLLA